MPTVMRMRWSGLTPDQYEEARKGVLPFLDPQQHFEVTQPGNILRIFERGGRFRPEIGVPGPARAL